MVGFASLLYAQSTADVMGALEDYAKDALIAVVVVVIIRKASTLRYAVWMLLLAALFLSSITTYQQITGTFTNNYGGFALADTQQIVTGTSDFRLAGPLSANYYALILVMIVPLALDRLWHEKSTLLRLLAAITLFTSVFSIIFTYSRGGFLALIVVLGLMLWHHRTKLTLIFALLLVGLVAFQYVPDQYKARMGLLTDLVSVITNEETAVVTDSSFRGRQSEITAAWQMFADHPFIGVGLGNYNATYLDYAEHLGLDTRGVSRSAHSLYLEIAAETGLIGLISFGLILAVSFQSLFAAYHIFLDINQRDSAYLTWALAVALVGYLTATLFLHLAYPRYFWLMIGLVIAAKNVAEYEKNQLRDPA
jgi:O-antigen ligase